MAFQPENGAPYTPQVIYQAPRVSASGGGDGPTRTARTSSSSSGGGSRAASVKKRQQKKAQTKVKDASGTSLVTNDATGFGLKRPYLLWNAYSTNNETNPAAAPTTSTTSGAFVSLLTLANEPQHPLLRVRFIVVTGAATTGEVRIVDRATGTVLGGPLVVGAAATVESSFDATLIAPTLSGAGAPYKVDMQARVTGGANSIALLVVYAIGIGT